MKRIMSLCVLIILMAIPITSLAEITQNDRLLQRPEWDGAVMQKHWIEGRLSYQSWEINDVDFNVISLGPTFITSLPNNPHLELGGRLNLMHFDPDGGDSETGISDIDVWGKYQFVKDEKYMMAAGLFLTLPTGSDDIIHPAASGEVNIEMFVAGRYQATKMMAVIGHFGFRKNSDMDIEFAGREAEIDGEMQLEIGGGAIFEVTPELNLQGELNIATEAYDDLDNDIQLRGGADFKVNQDLSLRGGLGIGLDDGAPDWELTVGCACTF